MAGSQWSKVTRLTLAPGNTILSLPASHGVLDKLTVMATSGARVITPALLVVPRINGVDLGSGYTMTAASAAGEIVFQCTADFEAMLIPPGRPANLAVEDALGFDFRINNPGASSVVTFYLTAIEWVG